jgi:hypothetical protein
MQIEFYLCICKTGVWLIINIVHLIFLNPGNINEIKTIDQSLFLFAVLKKQ